MALLVLDVDGLNFVGEMAIHKSEERLQQMPLVVFGLAL
jgi:hypothetical protein